MKDIILAVTTVISSLAFVLLLILLGWYIVWKLFLSRFKFVRELLDGGNSEASPQRSSKPKAPKARRDS